MNIQQALNQSLLSVAGSIYFTDQMKDQLEKSAIGEYQTSNDTANKTAAKLVQEESIPRVMGEKEPYPGYEKGQQIDLKKMNAAIQGSELGQRNALAQDELKRATKKLRRYAPRVAQQYEKLGFFDLMHAHEPSVELMKQIAKEQDAKALASLQNQQETYASQEKEKEKRFNTVHSGTYKSRMHQPSVSKEE